MANEKFQGHLLHTLCLEQDLISSIVATGNTETEQYEFEVLNAAVLLSCKNMLPVLKEIKAWIEPKSDLAVGNDGELAYLATIWNRDQDAIPEAIDEGTFYYECLGSVHWGIFDNDAAATLANNISKNDIYRNFGADGVMLRPRISVYAELRNISGSSASADSATIHIELSVDFVPVSEAEFNNYLQELWLYNAIVND